ncbi:MAG: 3-carboxy-cis,cis-muconate cycloisomerase [Terracidiphilus sp.]
MNTPKPSSQFSTPAMDALFSLPHQLACMTRFEAALLAALEANGIAPAGSAQAVNPLLDAHFADPEALIAESHRAGNIAIPFVRALTDAVQTRSEPVARFVHLGATSQDVLDTALVLQMRDALSLLRADFMKLDAALEKLVRTHAGTILSGRSWLQASPPVTLGLKLASVLAALRRHQDRLDAASSRAIVLQFGGAVGTLASLAEKGPAVSAVLAAKLALPEPAIPWHTQRDNLVELASTLALLTGTLGKFGKDIALLMQTEVAEVAEPTAEGRGGSSTMPHKHNPIASAVLLAAATRVPSLVATLLHAMLQEHERGLGTWQAEWETVPEIFRLTAASLASAVEIAEGLEVDAARMCANLEATQGLTLSEGVVAELSASIGRLPAHQLLERATRQAIFEKKHLRDVLQTMPEIRAHLTDQDLDRLFDPRNSLGSASHFIQRVLDKRAR